jgi:hypothetical protein
MQKGNNSKSGILKGPQRYVCKDCNYYYTADQATKRQLGKIFWSQVQDFRAKNPVKIVELEKIYVHWFKKNIAGYGVLLTEMKKNYSTGFKGSCHRTKTLKRHQRMRNRKRDDGLLEAVYIPPEQHIQSKAETFTVEGYQCISPFFRA